MVVITGLGRSSDSPNSVDPVSSQNTTVTVPHFAWQPADLKDCAAAPRTGCQRDSRARTAYRRSLGKFTAQTMTISGSATRSASRRLRYGSPSSSASRDIRRWPTGRRLTVRPKEGRHRQDARLPRCHAAQPPTRSRFAAVLCRTSGHQRNSSRRPVHRSNARRKSSTSPNRRSITPHPVSDLSHGGTHNRTGSRDGPACSCAVLRGAL
jgi:hypothetical protein